MSIVSLKDFIATAFLPALLISSMYGQSTFTQSANSQQNSAQSHDEPLVKDIYPGAQRWFEAMSNKYPQAQLSNVSFYVSSYCHSGKQAIYLQEDRLQKINVAYSSTINPSLTDQSHLDTLFKQDEYILLHEAGHVLKNHDTKAYVALALTAVVFAAVNGYITLSAVANPNFTFFGWLKFSMTAIIANSAICATLFSYIQNQEKEADAFANAQADEQTLKAGCDYLNLCIMHDQQLAYFAENLFATHPSQESRKQEIAKAIASRFVENT